MVVIPMTYDEWKQKITGRNELTIEFIDSRLSSLTDEHDEATQRFRELYGSEHLENVTSWFRRARRELVDG